MNIGILIPGFSSHAHDWAIPIQQHLVRQLATTDDVRVIALRYPHRRDCYRIDNATVYSLGAGQTRGIGRLALWLKTLVLLCRLHRERPFDVLHAMWGDETGLLAVWAGRLLHIPVAVSLLGGELVALPELPYGLQLGAFSRWIVGQALRADAVLPSSEYMRGLVSQAGYHVEEARIQVISLGVEANLFQPEDYKGNTGMGLKPTPMISPPDGLTQQHDTDTLFRLIHVASLVPVKDQATLLRELARLNESVVLDIIGMGPEEARLKQLAADLGISQRVNFIGVVTHPELPSYYRRATLHVVTSRHEGQPIVTLEAAACGVLTVGTAVGFLATSTELGVAVPVGDDAALAAAIRELLEDEPTRKTLARAARAAIEREYTVEHIAERLRRLYQDIRGRD